MTCNPSIMRLYAIPLLILLLLPLLATSNPIGKKTKAAAKRHKHFRQEAFWNARKADERQDVKTRKHHKRSLVKKRNSKKRNHMKQTVGRGRKNRLTKSQRKIAKVRRLLNRRRRKPRKVLFKILETFK